jgi:DNA-binding LacI/PurR family transcriptional regulator
MAKYEVVARLISDRIRRGDYALGGIPPEEKIAQEAGISRMTARKALEHVAQIGLIRRDHHGRRVVNTQAETVLTRQVAFLAPAYASIFYERLRAAAEYVIEEMGGVLRPVGYVHLDDPVVYETLDVFDGVFFISQPGTMPQRLIEKIKDPKRRVVGFGQAFAGGLAPCIDLMPPESVNLMLDHLYEAGHRRIACLNVQVIGASEERRIACWRQWCEQRGVMGTLLNRPAPIFTDTAPHAHRIVTDQLNAGPLRDSAIFCITEAAAMGAARALLDRGVRVGRDVALCTIADHGLNEFFSPSITAIEVPDPRPFIAVAAEWMFGRTPQWTGPRVLVPQVPRFFVGESTGGPSANPAL